MPSLITPELDRRKRGRGIYEEAERQFSQLLTLENLDAQIVAAPDRLDYFEWTLDAALRNAFGSPTLMPSAHFFLHRILYRINRLSFFWYDDLRHYMNDRSDYLRKVRDRIESAWERWELAQLPWSQGSHTDVLSELTQRSHGDMSLSAEHIYFRDHMQLAGYERLLKILSLDGPVETNLLSRVVTGAPHEIQAKLMRLFVEDSGEGPKSQNHTGSFLTLLRNAQLSTTPEAYMDMVPWEVLAGINMRFLLADRKYYFLRYIGSLFCMKNMAPANYRSYQAAAQRLGLGATGAGYWSWRIREDDRQTPWIFADIIQPLAHHYPQDAWQLVLGYDLQHYITQRETVTLAQIVQEADRENDSAEKNQ